MGKQPEKGQKKTKQSIAKAAAQSKKGKKKWSKGKVAEKVNHQVFLTQESFKDIMNGIGRIGKLVSVSGVVDKFKVSGSLARALMKRAHADGILKRAQAHSVIVAKAENEGGETTAPTKKDKKKKEK